MRVTIAITVKKVCAVTNSLFFSNQDGRIFLKNYESIFSYDFLKENFYGERAS